MKKLVVALIVLVGLIGFGSGIEVGLSVDATVTATPAAFELDAPELSFGYGFDVADGRLGVGLASISKAVQLEFIPYVDFFYPLWKGLGVGARVEYSLYPFNFDFNVNKPDVWVEVGLDNFKFDLRVFPKIAFGGRFTIFF